MDRKEINQQKISEKIIVEGDGRWDITNVCPFKEIRKCRGYCKLFPDDYSFAVALARRCGAGISGSYYVLYYYRKDNTVFAYIPPSFSSAKGYLIGKGGRSIKAIQKFFREVLNLNFEITDVPNPEEIVQPSVFFGWECQHE